MTIAKVMFQAVVFFTNGGDAEEADCKTLASARKTIKKMIGNKPYSDAYIRRYALDEKGNIVSTEDYDIEYGPKMR